MELTVITSPVKLPLDTSDVQEFLRLETQDDLETIQTLIKTANDIAQRYCNRTLLTTEYQLFHDYLPTSGDVGIRLAKGNIINVSELKIHLAAGGSTGTEEITDYILTDENMDGKLYPLSTLTWNTTGTARYKKGVEITYTAGYGNNRADIPSGMTNALLQIVSFLYENREGDDIAYGIPKTIQSLLDTYRIVSM